MKTEINITITAENACEFDSFVPVVGAYSVVNIESEDAELEAFQVVESIQNWLDAPDANVRIFTSDGREITGETPRNGTFVAQK